MFQGFLLWEQPPLLPCTWQSLQIPYHCSCSPPSRTTILWLILPALCCKWQRWVASISWTKDLTAHNYYERCLMIWFVLHNYNRCRPRTTCRVFASKLFMHSWVSFLFFQVFTTDHIPWADTWYPHQLNCLTMNPLRLFLQWCVAYVLRVLLSSGLGQWWVCTCAWSACAIKYGP